MAAPTNEELAGTANQLLEKVLQYLESAEAFGTEQVPLLVEEVLHYTIFTHSIKLALGVVLLGWAAFALRWSRRRADERLARIAEHTKLLKEERLNRGSADVETEDFIFTFYHYGVPVSGAAAALLGSIMFVSHAFGLIKPLIAPRLFLLEYFRALIG